MDTLGVKEYITIGLKEILMKDLNDLSKDELIDLVNKIASKDKVAEYLDEAIPVPKKEVINALHFLLCEKNHDSGGCAYHEETKHPECWSLTEHTLWKNMTDFIIESVPINIPELKQAIAKVVLIIQQIESMKKEPLQQQALILILEKFISKSYPPHNQPH